MTDIYKTIAQKSEGTYTEKRSKFLAFAHPVETLDQIKELIEGYKKKYYDARHVCYAYMLGAERATFRANDDGEPSSTAGKPILGQINSKELTNILVVVIRYFGGVKLGTSGLIIAYKEATIAALSNANIIEKQVEELISYTFPYVMMNSVMKVVKELNPQIVSQTYEQTCQITLSIRRSMAPILQERLNKLAF
jgi:xaa-pro dipeptidase